MATIYKSIAVQELVVNSIIDGAGAAGAIDIKSSLSIVDGENILIGTGTGTKIGDSAAKKIGFWGITPVIQPASAGQADQGAVTASTPGTGADGTTWTGAQCTAAFNDITAIDVLLTEIRTALVACGIMKGSA